MGLDIHYASRMKLVTTDHDEDPDEPGADWFYANRDYPQRAPGLIDGCYVGDIVGGFRAGSYSGYNRWREALSRLGLGVDPEQVWGSPEFYAGKPFFEVVCFSDCEGAIGAEVSAKLAADFAAYEERAATELDEYDLRVYRDFRRAFEAAADAGAVQFA